MAKDHEFQTADGHRLCVNNCGFFGSSATQNMCSKCYRSIQNSSSDPSSFFQTPLVKTSSVPSSSAAQPTVEIVPPPGRTVKDALTATENRCSSCRKKVGLTGFRCKCGVTYCGTHRYPEIHGCSFDFKGVGREAIAKANPLVIAVKLEKI